MRHNYKQFIHVNDRIILTNGVYRLILLSSLNTLYATGDLRAAVVPRIGGKWEIREKSTACGEGNYIAAFRRQRANQKDFALLANQRFDIKRGKSGSRQKNQIYTTVFQNQGEQKWNVIMSTGAAKANCLFVIFQNINYNAKPLNLICLHVMEIRYRKS